LSCHLATGASLVITTTNTSDTFQLQWGANIGPVPSGEAGNPPVTSGYRDIGVKWIRTHDYYGPLDMRAMYPDQGADPAAGTSYDFSSSDGVWQAIVTNGFRPYFRLGDSYTTNGPLAPTNQANWIEAAVQVIRHYTNASWSGTNPMSFIEIWNEPDNATFWEHYVGSRTEFFAFFTKVAQRLRAEFPELKLGGPGVTPASALSSSGTNYIPLFLDHLRSNHIDLDFLSWHMYSNDPSNYVQAARFYRQCLDTRGFTNTTLHVTEYNTEDSGTDAVAMRAWAPGAAVNAAAWMAMQTENVELATFYRGPDPNIRSPYFYGLFYADGQPKAVALAAKLHNQLAGYSNRLTVALDDSRIWALAGRTGNDFALLVSNPSTNSISWDLSLSDGRTPLNSTLVDIVPTSTNSLVRTVVYYALRTNSLPSGSIALPAWGVQLVTFSVADDYNYWAQTLYGLTEANAAPESDPDHDGFANLAEYTADTNPTNALSFFWVKPKTNSPPPALVFESSGQRLYSLYWCTNLSLPTWTVVPAQTDILGTGSEQTLTDTSEGTTTRYYRVGVRLP
jgi:hypothetical protein